MRSLALAVTVVVLSVVPSAAEMWRYEDENGNVAFTDDPGRIPAAQRASVRSHVPAAEGKQADVATGDLQGIMQKRREIIARYTPEQAERAVARGLLTIDEVNFLVTSGALRASAAGDAYRMAQKSSPRAATESAAAPVDRAERDLIMLQSLSSAASASTQVSLLRQFMQRITDSPNARYALMGEGALLLTLLVALPFILRRYHDDGTRRIIKTSLFFIFIIVSATGNLLLFGDDIAFLLAAGKVPAASTQPPPGAAAVQPPASK